MKKTVYYILAVFLFFAIPCLALAGNYVYGKVTYSDGSVCKGCKVTVMTESGISSPDYTDNNGEYRISISSNYIKKVYVSGMTKWEGHKSAYGGVRINVKAD